jgi:hypothetical protein
MRIWCLFIEKKPVPRTKNARRFTGGRAFANQIGLAGRAYMETEKAENHGGAA